MERKLASVQRILDISPIEGADRIERATILGWHCVVGKGEFKVGDLVVFLEVDSVTPQTETFKLLKDSGYRVKTRRFKKQISQGLCLPLSVFTNTLEHLEMVELIKEGDNITECLQIQKWEVQIPAQLAGISKGSFPEFMFKSDEQRINSFPQLLDKHRGKSFYVTEKLDGCFSYKTYLPTWDGKHCTIGDIVNKKLYPTLIGMDKQGNLVPTQVIKRFNNGRKEKWLEIRYTPPHYKRAGKKVWTLKVTPNHNIFTEQGEILAEKVRIGDNLISYATSPDLTAFHTIESGLLGDGCLVMDKRSESCRYTENHKTEHIEYSEEIIRLLGNCYGNRAIHVTEFNSEVMNFHSKAYHALHELRKKWYPKGKKIVPQDLSWIDDFSVAKWYMDDGSLIHNSQYLGQHDRARFSTNGFNNSDVERLAKKLEEMYGVSCSIYYNKGWEINILWKKGSLNNFWKAISPYIVPCMRYKLPEEYRKEQYKPIVGGSEILLPFTSKVLKIKNISNEKFVCGKVGYDLETTTHNYIANGILVHNSSMTVYLNNNTFGVCSRNLELKETDGNAYWKVARELDLESKLKLYGYNLGLQGELIGMGCQGNKYKLSGLTLKLFNIFDIDKRQYLCYDEFIKVAKLLGLETVPIISEDFLLPKTVDELVEFSKGKSLLNKDIHREGIVLRPLVEEYEEELYGRLSFKAINPNFLLKYDSE
jgi:hypothetical protein